MNLDDSKVQSSGFLDLRNLCSLIDLSSLCNLTGLSSLCSPKSSTIFLMLVVWSSLAPKCPIPVPYCGIDYQKSKFSQIYVSLFVGGCGGQNMLLFWKLIDETQMPQSQECTDAIIMIYKLFLVDLWVCYFISNPNGRPCS